MAEAGVIEQGLAQILRERLRTGDADGIGRGRRARADQPRRRIVAAAEIPGERQSAEQRPRLFTRARVVEHILERPTHQGDAIDQVHEQMPRHAGRQGVRCMTAEHHLDALNRRLPGAGEHESDVVTPERLLHVPDHGRQQFGQVRRRQHDLMVRRSEMLGRLGGADQLGIVRPEAGAESVELAVGRDVADTGDQRGAIEPAAGRHADALIAGGLPPDRAQEAIAKRTHVLGIGARRDLDLRDPVAVLLDARASGRQPMSRGHREHVG